MSLGSDYTMAKHRLKDFADEVENKGTLCLPWPPTLAVAATATRSRPKDSGVLICVGL
jgi:hypothetical protein